MKNYIVLAVGIVFLGVWVFSLGYIPAGIAALCFVLDAVFYLRARQKDSESLQKEALEKLSEVMRLEIKEQVGREMKESLKRLHEVETLLAIDRMGG